MNSDKQRLDARLKQNLNLDMGRAVDHCFATFKKTFLLNGLILFVVMLLIFTPTMFFMLQEIGPLGDDQAAIAQYMTEMTTSPQFLLGSIVVGVLLSPLFAGFVKLNRDVETLDEVSMNNVFQIYASPKLIPIVIYTLISTLILGGLNYYLTVVLELQFAGSLFNYVFQFFLCLTIPIIIFTNVNALEAIAYSFKFVAKKPLYVLGCLAISYAISFLGIFGFCIGIFFTLPIVYTMQYVLFDHLIGFKEDIENPASDFENALNKEL